MNKTAFFHSIRESLFKGRLSQGQVDGINTLLAVYDADYAEEISYLQLAYVLGTVFHETGRTMQPVPEIGQEGYFARYDGREDLGNTEPGDGYRFRGRGYVQITGRNNYAKASEKLGIDLVNHPVRALEPDIAAKILFSGMQEGWFTGRKLDDFIRDEDPRFVDARKIVNGRDKAPLIASYAHEFLAAFNHAATAIGDEDVQIDGKKATQSTTNIAAFVGGMTGLLGTISGHLTNARAALDAFLDGSGLPTWVPILIVAIVGLAAFGWIVKERYLKSYYEGI